LKKIIKTDFGNGMEHIKKIESEKIIILNSGFSYKSEEIESIHIKDCVREVSFK